MSYNIGPRLQEWAKNTLDGNPLRESLGEIMSDAREAIAVNLGFMQPPSHRVSGGSTSSSTPGSATGPSTGPGGTTPGSPTSGPAIGSSVSPGASGSGAATSGTPGPTAPGTPGTPGSAPRTSGSGLFGGVTKADLEADIADLQARLDAANQANSDQRDAAADLLQKREDELGARIKELEDRLAESTLEQLRGAASGAIVIEAAQMVGRVRDWLGDFEQTYQILTGMELPESDQLAIMLDVKVDIVDRLEQVEADFDQLTALFLTEDLDKDDYNARLDILQPVSDLLSEAKRLIADMRMKEAYETILNVRHSIDRIMNIFGNREEVDEEGDVLEQLAQMYPGWFDDLGNLIDFFEVLNINAFDTWDETTYDTKVKKAYRKAANAYHPDKHSDKADDDPDKIEAETMFKLVSMVIAVFEDEEMAGHYLLGYAQAYGKSGNS